MSTKEGVLKDVSVPCWGKAINTRIHCLIITILRLVSVPCWGKAINTRLLKSNVSYKLVSVPCWGKAINTFFCSFFFKIIEEVSVPCWGKAINTDAEYLKRYCRDEAFPSPVGVRPLTRA